MKRALIKFWLLAAVFAAFGLPATAQQATAKQTADYDALIDRYFESLNEPDAKRRDALVRQVWTENGTFVYPGQEVTGHAAISRDVEKVQKQYPGALVRRTSKIEIVHHNYIRFTWEFGPAGREPLITGVDFAVVANGKLQLVVGFFDVVRTTAFYKNSKAETISLN